MLDVLPCRLFHVCQMFSAGGNFVRAFSVPSTGVHLDARLAVLPDNQVAVSTVPSRIDIFSLDGSLARSIDCNALGQEPGAQPVEVSAMATDVNGNLVIADNSNKRLLSVSTQGEQVRQLTP